MSLWSAIAVTALRSTLLVLLAIPICKGLKSFLRSAPRWRSLAWVLLLAPVIAPRMLTGFGYANFSLSLVSYPLANEFLYAGLLLLTIVPVGTVISYFAPPPPVSEEAMHCMDLARPKYDGKSISRGALAPVTAISRSEKPGASAQRLSILSGLKRFRLSQIATSAGLMFILAFQEFELASLMGVTSWTVWLFDAQTGGLILSESLRYAVLPLICELLILTAVGVSVWRNAGLVSASQEPQLHLTKAGCRSAWAYLCLSLVLFCCVPWSFILHAAVAGLSQLTKSFTIGSDIVAGCLFAFLATSVAYGLARLFIIHTEKRHRQVLQALLSMIGVPGLLGSLVLGLSILFVFQSSALHTLYGTPIPWMAGLVLFLLPRAFLVMLILAVVRSPEAAHLTKLMMRSGQSRHRAHARDLQWHSSWAFHFVTFLMLFFWAYSDLTSAAILAPPGIVSAPVRLYNLMHYGQSAVLSAMIVATFGIPALVFGTIVLLRRPLHRVLVP